MNLFVGNGMKWIVRTRSCYNLILFGYKSSGKTYFGKLLSQELGCGFVDTDQLVEDFYEKKFCKRLNCRQISIQIGEEGFRQLERYVIDSLEGVTNTVIAVGGGVVLNPVNCDSLSRNGKFVYLEVEKKIIKERIFREGVPSFLDSHNLERSFEAMHEKRKPIYENMGLFKVSVRGKTDRQVLDELQKIVS